MSNLYLIVADDEKVVQFYLHDILSRLKTDSDNKIVYDLNVSSLSDILDEASMISLFDSYKIIIGNNFDLGKLTDDDVDYLKRYLSAKKSDTTIILITSKVDARRSSYKLFKDNFKIIDAIKSDNSDDLVLYVKKVVKEKGYQISDMDINYFLSKVGNDINNINSELDKLFIYKQETKKVDMHDIELLIADNIDNIVYEFTNAIIDNDYNKVAQMYNNFKIQNVSFDYLLSILANNFHQLLTIKLLNNEGKSNMEIAKIIGKKEYYVKKNLERTFQYSISDFAYYIAKLAQIDYNFKSGKSNIDELELFLLSK